MNDPYKSFVIICRDGVPEVTPFCDINEATQFYDLAKEQWSESYLCEAVAGPGLLNPRSAAVQCYEALREWVSVSRMCINSVDSFKPNTSPALLRHVFNALRDGSRALLADRNSLRDKCAEQAKNIAVLVGLLRKLEWSVCYDLDECAICDGFKYHEGHKPDCQLHAALESHK